MTEKNDSNGLTESVKSFIYLDTDKMYSISSQLFSGLTDHILTHNTNASTKEDRQKGDVFTGRTMGDIVVQSTDHSEKKFLHDYAYTLFENKLLSAGRVTEIAQKSPDAGLSEISSARFIKATGRITLVDTELVSSTMRNFNDLGYALTLVPMGNSAINALIDAKENAKSTMKGIKDRNLRSKAEHEFRKIPSIRDIAEAKGLHLNEEWLQKMAYMIDYGYSGQLDFIMPLISASGKAFLSAPLDRSMLKEPVKSLVKKYSKNTEKEFTIFGIATQTSPTKEDLMLKYEEQEDQPLSIKQAVMNMAFEITNIENMFSDKQSDEYVIDPIAVYLEI